MKKHKQKEVGFQAKEKNQERNKKQVASDEKKKKEEKTVHEREGVQPQTPQSMHHFPGFGSKVHLFLSLKPEVTGSNTQWTDN